MNEDLKELEAELSAVACVGDVVVDGRFAKAIALVKELAKQEEDRTRAFDEPREEVHGTTHLEFDPEWKRDACVTVGGAPAPSCSLFARAEDGSALFCAVVHFVPKLGCWRAMVFMNGTTIYVREEEQRLVATFEAREAIYRAWRLRGPIR